MSGLNFVNKTKKIILSILAAAMTVPVMADSAVPLTVSAECCSELLWETDFDYKILPWHLAQNSPAMQDFSLDDGSVHITIMRAVGAQKEKFDLQFRVRNLDFRKNHSYRVSFKAKASRDGFELCSTIGQPNSPYEEYFVLDEDGMHDGPDMGGQYPRSCAKLSTEWKEYTGTFHCTRDLEAMQWAFQYAQGTTYKGNAKDGDEIWFDDTHIIEYYSDDTDSRPPAVLSYTNRDAGTYRTGIKNNFISVNQLGYYPGLAKIATLGDNNGDFFIDAAKISLKKAPYTWELVENESGKVVKTGTTGKAFFDNDSGDTVCKIDFSDYNKEGTYYLRIKDTEWRSFPFRIGNDIYEQNGRNLLTDALNYFYQNRSGCGIESEYITSGLNKDMLAHEASHKAESAFVQSRWIPEYMDKKDAEETYASSNIETEGGWYDAELFSKNLVSGGIAVWTLQNMYERAVQTEAGTKKFADGSGTCVVPETGNNVPDVLDECRYELDYMQKLKVQENEPTWGQYAGLYYHSVMDHKWTGLAVRPWDYVGPEEEGRWDTVRIAKPPTFAATLNYAACAAQAARLWKPYDAEYAAELLQSAKDAYTAFLKNYYEPNLLITVDPDTGKDCAAEELDTASLYARVNTTGYSYIYGDLNVTDDAYWAACELYLSASEMNDADAEQYFKYLSRYKDAFRTATRITGGANDVINMGYNGSYSDLNWGNTATAGTFSLLLHRDLLNEKANQTLQESLLETANSYLATTEKQGYGIPYLYDGPRYTDPNGLDPKIRIDYGFETGSNAYALYNMIAMAYAYDLTKDIKYLDGVSGGMDYLLGNNPLTFSYITGYGSYAAYNPTHKFWAHVLDKTLPEAPDGVLTGGPTTRLYDQYVRLLGLIPGDKDNVSERCYVDSVEAWSVNSTALEYNAPLAWVVSFMQDQGKEITDTHPVRDLLSSETTTTVSQLDAAADPGNVNGDETVDISDAVLLARFVAEDTEVNLTAEGKHNADVNRNGKPDSDDVILILKYIAKLIDQF